MSTLVIHLNHLGLKKKKPTLGPTSRDLGVVGLEYGLATENCKSSAENCSVQSWLRMMA